MSIKWNNKKVSSNEMAKILIDDQLDSLIDGLYQNFYITDNNLTEAEESALYIQIEKKIESVRKSLGIEKMFRKIENR